MQTLNTKTTGSSLTASEFNEPMSELQNVITALGQTLSSGDLNQLGKSIAGYVANGTFYTDSGAADAYTLAPIGSKQAPTAYTDGMRIAFLASNTNTGASTVNVASIGVKSLKDKYGNDPQAGDIGATFLTTGYYDSASDYFILDSIPEAKNIFPVEAGVAANALTLTLNPTTIDFRSSTLTSGAVNRRTVDTAISIIVSNGSTLGTVNGDPSRLIILAIDNAGTVELGIVNASGIANLDESSLISTTAEGGAGGADSADLIYSTTARSNVAFRIVGFIEITEATAGVWATGPTKVQGAGGNVTASWQSIGYGQAWQDVTASRSSGTTYANTTGRPIMVYISISAGATDPSAVQVSTDGTTWIGVGAESGTVQQPNQVIVPAGHYYRLNGASFAQWSELR